jgi:ribosomal protein L11 methyltransferase
VIRLAVRCRAEDADRVLAELLELFPDGVEEDRGEEFAEYAVYGAPGELPALPDLEAEGGGIEVSTTEIPDDWADRWRDFHRPIAVGDGRLVVRPSWEPADAPAAPVEVVVDPGQAFGTGAHATTRMCLELLLELANENGAGGPLVDLGTGSGVLAIAAVKLGWHPVIGVDHERSALEAASANARANGVELDLRRVNLREQPPPVAATMVANLTGPLLRDVAGRLEDEVPRDFVCSGALASEADAVAESLLGAGLRERTRRTDGEWVALALRST